MLIAEPTKYGAGVSIYGDYWDLNELHETIHYLAEANSLSHHLSDFVHCSDCASEVVSGVYANK